MGSKDHDAALRTLTRFVEKYPESTSRAEAHLLRAYAFAVLDNADRAVADLEAVVALAPDSELAFKAIYIVDLVRRKR